MKLIHLPLHQGLPIQVLDTNTNLQHSPNLSQHRTSVEATSAFLAVSHTGLLQTHARGPEYRQRKCSSEKKWQGEKKKSQYSSLGQSFSYSYKGLKSSRNKRFSQHKGHCSSSLITTSQIGKAPSPLFCPGFSTHKKREAGKRKRAK